MSAHLDIASHRVVCKALRNLTLRKFLSMIFKAVNERSSIGILAFYEYAGHVYWQAELLKEFQATKCPWYLQPMASKNLTISDFPLQVEQGDLGDGIH